jgi:hypothetical protein
MMDTANLPQIPLTKSLPSAPDVPLHDIKPLVEVSDYSIYYFSAMLVLIAVILAVVGFFAWKYYKSRTDKSLRKAHYKALKEVNFSNSKMAAYAITKHGYAFKNDGTRQSETYENLLVRLAPYKYKKEVGVIDEETRGYYAIYLEMIDV